MTPALSPVRPERGGLSIIEQVGRLTSENGCTKASRCYCVGIKESTGQGFFFRPDCKCWNCEACAARLRARWTLRTFKGVEAYQAQGEHFTFVTLTSSWKLKGLAQTLWVWPKAWSMLRRRVQRAAPGWHFVMIPEQHKDGRLHVHLLASANLGTDWWSDNAVMCGLGWKAEEAEFKCLTATAEHAAAYAAKYLGKQWGVKEWPRYFHHIRTSQRFPALPPLEAGFPYDQFSWERVSPKEFQVWLSDMQSEGYHLIYTGTGETL